MLSMEADAITRVDINYTDGSNEEITPLLHEDGEQFLDRMDNLYYGDYKAGMIDNIVFYGDDDELEMMDASVYYGSRFQGFTLSNFSPAAQTPEVQHLLDIVNTGNIMGRQW